MSERHIVVSVQLPGGGAPFNGSTKAPEFGPAWSGGKPNTKMNRLTLTSPVGRFSAAALGRGPGLHSVVRVYTDNDIVDGDYVRIVGSDVSGEALPGGTSRGPVYKLTNGVADAVPLELGPTDYVQLALAAGNAGQGTVRMVVYDLDEAQLDRRDNQRLAASTLATALAPPAQVDGYFFTTTDPALGNHPGWDNLRYYSMTNPGPITFTLPTAPKIGTTIIINQSNNPTVTVNAGANVIKSAGTSGATLAMVRDTPLTLKYFTGVWVQV